MRGWFAWLSGRFGRGSRERLDPDVRDVFIGELDELTRMLSEARPALRSGAVDAETLQPIRRGFHTIKGSGQMVGALTLGRFCGHIEKLAQSQIEKRGKPQQPVLDLIGEAIDLLPDCTRAVRTDRPLPPTLKRIDRDARKLLDQLGYRLG
ncbi:MAG: Hpt domain-containing protein [Xanthomonadales bacterium]|nr:Hpt domain-containing protein [Xanthomonadales bacterium]